MECLSFIGIWHYSLSSLNFKQNFKFSAYWFCFESSSASKLLELVLNHFASGSGGWEPVQRLEPIPGTVPSLESHQWRKVHTTRDNHLIEFQSEPRPPLTSQHFVGCHVGVRDDVLDAADLPVELDGVLQVVLVLVADRLQLWVFGQHLRFSRYRWSMG